ncbi:ubiquinone/menaquinone biosynthesis methyltransferase [Sedimentimonas flavescens]|uniref:Ubiquinone/menaquinone biosynthesis C-methyltransferase UbiE n=1 Tax=Sedimentimonas flavescens TaxID=2851012 RepID=A0ABT3A215_9RHOB|nr:ubiquinone/menaquinone biosynthesis methyltransferase [Sedimentimonas flavescens]MCV2880042.1 ubiquinone/menaquinone biosynthesis methyltransferase [Sedimentimonas flavescens]WBL32811.1 ubiquinone/menaquinone biosynthesis methyltransferase [Sinirhodobacter sp. HNIBRBA609]
MPRASQLDDLRTSFGEQSVAEEIRRDEVRALFDRIAPRYDLMNDLMSFGTHRLWKRKVISRALYHLLPGEAPIVDLAGGTGDLAIALRAALPGRRIIVTDPSAGMLGVARERAGDALEYLQAAGEDLPLSPASVAMVTLSFGLRNMSDPAQGLREVARVLAPGGHLVLLEFSKPDPWFAPFYGIHARHVIPRLGALVARDQGAYQYLVESIERFPARQDMAREIAAAGLELVEERAFVFGVARMQIAKKPQ